ncbi:MAG: hypothetical protein F4210_04015 [Holophagales bacterium]|nr:hypothetical protein [Holophagales bacterium]MYF94671.1 hypothetical protein [Holophagales bacterium]
MKTPECAAPAGLAAILVFSAQAAALVYIMPTDESMVDRAPVIVFGEVIDGTLAIDAAQPSTHYRFRVEEVLKGVVADSTIVVRQPGGVGNDGTSMWIMGLPMLAEKDRVLLFLRREAAGAHDIVEYALGMFWEVDVGGPSLLLREPSLEGETALAEEPGTETPPRNARLFRRWIADRVAGQERSADYFVAEAQRGPVAVTSPYRLSRLPEGQEGCLAAHGGLPYRWQEFDRGESLGFVVDSGGQPGVPGGGLRQVRAGMSAWNGDPRSRVDLTVLRTTNELLKLSAPDGLLSIMYEDPHDEIEGQFGDGGENSGVLAVTLAVSAASCASHRIPGRAEDAVALAEMNIVTQDGLGELLRAGDLADPTNYFERIVAHELGHALGIAHPCEIDEADCNDSHPHRGALMYPAGAASDPSRARLHSDDRDAVRYLYPRGGGNTPQPPPPDPTGCTPTTTALRLDGGYDVSMCYVTPQGEEGQAKAGVWASSQAGVLWFFDRENAEVLVKVLDGCVHNGHRWVFVAPVTDLEFTLWVTAPNGKRWTHSNTQGRTAATRSDTSAFRCADEDTGG